MKEEKRKMQAEINRLTFDHTIATNGDGAITAELSSAQSRLATLEYQIAAPQSELDRLTRQFWVTKDQVKGNKYDLSASRYRQVEANAAYHEKPSITLERLSRLEQVMLNEINELKNSLK